MNDIRPPQRPVEPIAVPSTPLIDKPVPAKPMLLQPINPHRNRPKPPVKNKLLFIVAAIVVALISVVVASILWYNVQLSAKGTDLHQLTLIEVKMGTTPAEIGQLLQDKAVIRNGFAFNLYARLSHNQGNLQAGNYRLSPAETIPQIINHLVKGTVDEFSITFLPGATLKQDRTVLLEAGFSATDIDTALGKTYDTSVSTLFANKPASSDLEGYIYGQTYNFSTGATVDDILQRTFTEFNSVIKQNNLESGFAAQGLNLYQGITLASIVQREMSAPSGTTEPTTDQKQVAQVFYSRLAQGMPLGSDVTYQYAADKLGVARDVNLDSPYNTRRYAGLPPGPIANPGITALKAVASPATTNYLFFLSGDDNKTYFASTEAEHQANIANHCQVNCSKL
jgi:UPF0755 protein